MFPLLAQQLLAPIGDEVPSFMPAIGNALGSMLFANLPLFFALAAVVAGLRWVESLVRGHEKKLRQEARDRAWGERQQARQFARRMERAQRKMEAAGEVSYRDY
jgi:hypothetical protein